ncbi:hypothetical protein ABZP36_001662, partial [Zizania latifolia]
MTRLAWRVVNAYPNQKGQIISTGNMTKSDFAGSDRTFSRTLEFHKEFLHPIVHHLHLVVAHHPATTKKPTIPNS